jgi:hypothetical protein
MISTSQQKCAWPRLLISWPIARPTSRYGKRGCAARMIFSSRGVLQYAMRPILLDDPAHYRPIAPAFEVSKKSAGKRVVDLTGSSDLHRSSARILDSAEQRMTSGALIGDDLRRVVVS